MEYSAFGAIYCINLLEREDRFEETSSFFAKHNIPATFHRVQRHPKGGAQGCFESHIQVITKAYNSGARNVLVFEDDVDIGRGFGDLNEAISFMQNVEYDLLYLGWHPRIFDHRTHAISKQIYSVSAFGCHAYVVSRPMMARLANLEFRGTPIDELFSNHVLSKPGDFPGHVIRKFALYPSAFVQRGSSSDIAKNFSSEAWMKPVRRLIEAYSVNVNYRIESLWKVALVVVIVIAILALWKTDRTVIVATAIILTILMLTIMA